MASSKMFVADTNVELQLAPIRPEWIIEGAPVARHTQLSQGRTRHSYTYLWDCTAGIFNWIYDVDEVVHILEGSVLLSQDGGPVRRVVAGDVVIFPAGSTARWEVETYVRKLAVFGQRLPKPLDTTLNVLRSLKSMLRGKAGAAVYRAASMPG